ncbi:MAG: O-antigen ligase family protein [Solirubrobacterales bacterium]|nr:O-antigen ligase family protein [Solirubrobacterales bacterium]
MRNRVAAAACATLLAGPTVLAFFSGGYFDEPRAWAGLIAWLLVGIGALITPRPLAIGRGGVIALAGLAGLAAWTMASITWAPVAGSAYHAGQLVVLYLGALLASAILLRPIAARRAVEPALALGALIVVGYGISERWLPGLLQFSRSASAQGRLEQPLTYWNAMGELAAIGFVLCVRLAGDASRQLGLRVLALAASVPLAQGLYLSVSRGALFACAAGLLALFVLAPSREGLRTLVLAVLAGGLAVAAAAPFAGVTSLSGTLATREREGAICLALVVLITALAAAVQWRMIAGERPSPLRLPRAAPWLATAAIAAGLALAIVAGAKERSNQALTPGATRLTTLQSNRYAYWSVATRAFSDEPIRGVGAGGWSVYWLRYRHVSEFAQDAHSLELQTLAELGVVGELLLITFLGGVALAARDARRLDPMLAAGPIAGCLVWLAHSPLDWDWQMPAVTLVAMGLAGALLAARPEADPQGRQPDHVRRTREGDTVSEHEQVAARAVSSRGLMPGPR